MVKKLCEKLVLLLAPLVFMGALWQLEIADNCLLNGWDFKFFFNMLVFSDVWAVRDFWMLIIIVCMVILWFTSARLTEE